MRNLKIKFKGEKHDLQITIDRLERELLAKSTDYDILDKELTKS